MKKPFLALLLAAVTLSFSACRDEDNLPYPQTEEFPVIFTTITAGQSSFRVAEVNAGTGNPTATFDIEVKGGESNQIDAIEVYRTFRGFNVPTTGNAALGLGPRALLRTVAPNSGSIDVSINDAINGLTRATGATQGGARTPITRTSLRTGEGFLFTYELVLRDGRRIVYTPLQRGVVTGAQANAPYSGLVNIVN